MFYARRNHDHVACIHERASKHSADSRGEPVLCNAIQVEPRVPFGSILRLRAPHIRNQELAAIEAHTVAEYRKKAHLGAGVAGSNPAAPTIFEFIGHT